MAEAKSEPLALTRKEVAAMLGVSLSWMNRHINDGPAHYKIPGGLIRYKLSDVENWLRQRRIE